MEELEQELASQYDLHFDNEQLLQEALTQANYLNEHPEVEGNDYQRLEFLGDAVMQQSTAVYLFKRFPDWDEGRLTELRIAMVQTRSFAALSRELHLDRYIRLGRGEELSGACQRDSLLEDIWEAFIGALYLDQGQAVVMRFLEQILFAKIDEGFFEQFVDYKSKLQEYLQKDGPVAIKYQKLSEKPLANNDQIFEVEVMVNQQVLATGQGKSTKAAEKDAARNAYQQLTTSAEKK